MSRAGGAEPCLCVLMIAEDVPHRGDSRRELASLAAEDRRDGLGCVAAPLGKDPDGVPFSIGRVPPEGLGGAFQLSPGPTDQTLDHSGDPVIGDLRQRPAIGTPDLDGRAVGLQTGDRHERTDRV
jgi:hypothetical protein